MINVVMPSLAIMIHHGTTDTVTLLVLVQLVKAIGQKAYDNQLAHFNPYCVPDTCMNLSINPEFIEKVANIHGALDSILWICKHAVVFVVNGIMDLCNSTIHELFSQLTLVKELRQRVWIQGLESGTAHRHSTMCALPPSSRSQSSMACWFCAGAYSSG